ncbi:hypothetical protein [Halalkalibacter oceani]|uniref:hypothetical protein n=1 Tax=Halalkalibacter oceani TaxID=1653776 RepID=UPI003394E81A
MAIRIQTEQTGIPVEIGELKFIFDTSDESIIRFRKGAEKLQDELMAIEFDKNDELAALESAKDALRRGFDFMLGEGSFDRIYEQTPSVYSLTKYFEQIAEGLEKELKAMGHELSQADKAKKYLKAKKKKK